jgi:putative Mn2+ efflux pump MntP
MQILGGFILMVIGAFTFYKGLKEDNDAMGGLKYRKLIVGVGAFFFGLIIMFR